MINLLHNPIKRRITLTTVSFTLIITILIATVSFTSFQTLLKKSLVQSTEFSLQVAMTSISNKLKPITNLAEWGNQNNRVIKYLSANQNEKQLKLHAYTRLAEEHKNNTSKDYINRISIGNSKGYFIQLLKNVSEGSANDYQITINQPFFEDLLNAPAHSWIGITNDPFVTFTTKQIIPIIKPIYNEFNNNKIGWTYLSISTSLITDALLNFPKAEDSNLYFIMGDKTYLYENGNLKEVTPTYEIRNDISYNTLYQGSTAYEVVDPAGKKHTIVSYTTSSEGWYLAQTLSETEFATQKKVFYALIVLICLVTLLLGLVLTYYLNRIITAPISALTKKINEISLGDFSYDPNIEWNHELGIIGKGVNKLSTDVVTLMDTRIKAEQHQKELEYQILQSQINPHFLYNTLNSIKWMATIQNATGIAEMTTALSRLLKSISKGTKQIITIREELELLKNYVLIQKYRYGGSITVEYQIASEALLDYEIPRFTLQPIVENAIFHGIEAKGGNGLITISIEQIADSLQIEITDNGIGMSQELIDQVLAGENEELHHDFFKKIGVNNVHQRIQYTFGEKNGLKITSEVGKYTTMSIMIPCRKGDLEDEETIDC